VPVVVAAVPDRHAAEIQQRPEQTALHDRSAPPPCGYCS